MTTMTTKMTLRTWGALTLDAALTTAADVAPRRALRARTWGALALSAMLAGCGTLPAAPATKVSEQRVSGKKTTSRATSAAKPMQAGPGSRAATGAAAMQKGLAPAAAAQAASPMGLPPVLGAQAPSQAGAPASPRVDAAPAAADGSNTRAVTVVAPPPAGTRIFVVRDYADNVVDAAFTPESGDLTWTLRAPADGLIVGKVKLVFAGGDAPVTLEVTPDQLSLPARLSGETRLALPFALEAALPAFKGALGKQVTLTATFSDAAGQAVLGADGQPLQLGAPIQVM